MKKVLIVTGSDYSPCVYEGLLKAKEMGYKLYLLSDGTFNPRPEVFEKHFQFNLRNTLETLEYIKKQSIHFDAVTIKTSEWLTPLVALLAKHYGCKGNDPLVAFACRSKYHMRQKLAEGNVSIPKFVLCRNYDELLQATKEIGIPCVAKPVGGNASYGTFLIRDKTDLDSLRSKYESAIAYLREKAVDEDVFAFRDEEMKLMGVSETVDMVTDYLVEEYMEGPEISVDALVQNGKVFMLGIEDQVRMKPPYMLQTAARLPYLCSKSRETEIYELVCRTVAAMGITDSATHTEIIFTSTGPRIVEIGCRIGGDNIHDSVFHITGYNLMFESIMIALGEPREYEPGLHCHTFTQYVLPEKEGIVQSINIPAKVYKNSDIIEIEFPIKSGAQVAPPPKSFDFLGYISAKGKTQEKAEQTVQEALNDITFIIS